MASSPPPVFSFTSHFSDDEFGQHGSPPTTHITDSTVDGSITTHPGSSASATQDHHSSSSPPPPRPHSPSQAPFHLDEGADIDFPWVSRDLNHSSSSQNLLFTPSPHLHALTHRASELNLSAHPSRHVHARKSHARTACFVHSLLQNGRSRSPSRQASSEDLARAAVGSFVDNISKGPERRDRWNRGMTKKELSDMALGVRELSKRLGM